MQKIILTLFLFSISFALFAQEIPNKPKDTIDQEEQVFLRGKIISIEDREPLQSAHVVNLNTVRGTITNTLGQFQIPASANDTIFISYIGYQSIKLKITKDLLKGNELEIAIHEKIVNIEEQKEIQWFRVGTNDIELIKNKNCFGWRIDYEYKIKEKYSHFDADRKFKIAIEKHEENVDCIAGEILKGNKNEFKYSNPIFWENLNTNQYKYQKNLRIYHD